MDWTTILKAQQVDFIHRLNLGCLLHCDKNGKHSELTVISADRLLQLRKFCWRMANKFKQKSDVEQLFINNMKGKLGEEVVKARLADLVTEVDYEERFSGDGKVDFNLTANPSVGIQVKARHGKIDTVKWSISQEEIKKNAVLICILIQEEVNEAQTKYNLIMAGFLPTNMIQLVTEQSFIGIEELLYCGGLCSYLEYLQSLNVDEYILLGDDCYKVGDYQSAIAYYSQALKLEQKCAIAYYKRGDAYHAEGFNLDAAVDDYTQAITINPYYADAFYCRGLIHSDYENLDNAMQDYTQAITINQNHFYAYYQRSKIRLALGDIQVAMEDCAQAITINPDFVPAHDYLYNLANNKNYIWEHNDI